MESLGVEGHWIAVKDGDLRAYALFRRHYSALPYRRGRRNRLIAGPGEKMVLLTVDCRALFVWRKFIDRSGQCGVNCAVFRNEGPVLSSMLIGEACELAWMRWPNERLYTYVNPRKVRPTMVRGQPVWGWTFLRAGWRLCGRTKTRRLLILERTA